MSSIQTQRISSGPWWKYGHMWLVVGGPAVVVVASFITLYLAVTRPDPVYADAPRGVQVQPADENDPALTPAMQGRNHAASPASAKALAGTAPARQPGHP
ncbi:nitrogen fixation protein FixH [Ottowia thiooxydans]|uniref:Nitrogen fixation protein FixH n=1 Tax=Ottowia thiooxydans TaxID=219182 RepID=A0ABV2QI19_9BURK